MIIRLFGDLDLRTNSVLVETVDKILELPRDDSQTIDPRASRMSCEPIRVRAAIRGQGSAVTERVARSEHVVEEAKGKR